MDAKKLAALEAKVKRFTKAKAETRELARRALIGQGIYTEQGEVAAEYGGDRTSAEQNKR